MPIAFRASGDLRNKAGMLSNGNMSGESEAVGTMGTIPIKFKTGRKLKFDALLETGERKPLKDRIKAIRVSGEMAIRNIRPTGNV